MMDALIQVRQLPIIEERLWSTKNQIDACVSDALSLICTAETIQTVKATRAALRKQFEELEEQRKAVKSAVLGPYEQFEQVYKECVSNTFKGADASLKQKIDDVESEIKRRCEDGLREYFAELCVAHHLEWLKFEQAGIKVDMTSAKQKTPKKLREQLAQFVARISTDVDRIADMDDAEEIMTEYKRTLNAMDAIGIVRDRQRRIEEERAANEARNAVRAQEIEAVKRVEAATPPVQTPILKEAEPILHCTFTVHATRPQLRKLKDFLNMEGIKYE